MNTALGNIERAELLGSTLVVTGHQWVALAFAEDEPFMVTYFVGIKRELTAEETASINDASEVYDYWITPIENGFAIRFVIWARIEVAFECAQVITKYRYYEPLELEQIFRNLGGESPSLLQGYIREIERHGFEVTNIDGQPVFKKL